ncbi:MAG: hypothetical protein Q8L23_12480 [Caulobacter sp.]|nr:hypothetical protein [Caulobacter sp.]
MRHRSSTAIAVSLLLCGCASTKTVPIESTTTSTMSNQTISYTDWPTPPFTATTSGGVAVGALFGAVGGAAMAIRAINMGNELVKVNQIADPADSMALSLTNALATSTSATVGGPITPAGGKPQDIAASAQPARYVVDVRTIGWGTMYYLADLTRYGVVYQARMQVIDTTNNTVVAEAFCLQRPAKGEAASAPTYDELVADGAVRLKALLAAAGETCAAKFRTEALKL